MKPDFSIRRRADNMVVFVGDAKWKTGSEPKRSDLYQIASYQAKYRTPEMFVYPDLEATIEDVYSFQTESGTDAGRGPLTTVELTTSDISDYDSFVAAIKRQLHVCLPAAVTAGTASRLQSQADS